MDTVCNGIGDKDAIQVDKEFRVKKIGMVCRMVCKDFIKIEKFIWSVAFKPSLIKLLLERINLLPDRRFPFLEFLGLNQLNDFFRRGKSVRFKIRFRDHDRVPNI
jgi:hypothetical protein